MLDGWTFLSSFLKAAACIEIRYEKKKREKHKEAEKNCLGKLATCK
jgi:hypothetical protein